MQQCMHSTPPPPKKNHNVGTITRLILNIRSLDPRKLRKLPQVAEQVSNGAGICTWAVCLWRSDSMSGFLNPNSIDTWCWILLCCASVWCGKCSSTLGLCLLDASSIPAPQLWQPKRTLEIADVPTWGQNCLWLRTTALHPDALYMCGPGEFLELT